jgi:uncharacterized protein YndB with AHSA1/START domain
MSEPTRARSDAVSNRAQSLPVRAGTGDARDGGILRRMSDASSLTLHLERVLYAPRDRVFAAFVEPAQLGKWWGPAGFTARSVEFDAREGGRYRIKMQPPDGDAFYLRGQYSEVDPPQRLVHTFEYEQPDPDDRVTLVTLSFFDHPDGTRLVFEQGSFTTPARYELHETGWSETLDRLAEFLS